MKINDSKLYGRVIFVSNKLSQIFLLIHKNQQDYEDFIYTQYVF